MRASEAALPWYSHSFSVPFLSCVVLRSRAHTLTKLLVHIVRLCSPFHNMTNMELFIRSLCTFHIESNERVCRSQSSLQRVPHLKAHAIAVTVVFFLSSLLNSWLLFVFCICFGLWLHWNVFHLIFCFTTQHNTTHSHIPHLRIEKTTTFWSWNDQIWHLQWAKL